METAKSFSSDEIVLMHREQNINLVLLLTERFGKISLIYYKRLLTIILLTKKLE